MKPPPSNEYTTEIIYAKENASITVSKRYSEGAVNLLKQTIYGTSGPKYQHTGHEKKIKHLTDPYFFDLKVDKILVGTYCLSGRLASIPAGNIDSFYGRYLSVNPAYCGKGYGSLLKTEAVKYMEGKIKRPHLFYSYVEESNGRSMRISNKENFTSIGLLEAIVFSRLYPKMDNRVLPLKENELDSMLSLLKTAYQNHTLVHFDQVYYEQNYFVLKENGEVIAGVQANPILWRIIDMPGLSGKFIMNVLPHVPVMRRLINPDKYQFLVLEAIYIKPGHNKELLLLLESVLHHFNVTSALMMLDVNSPINQKLKEMGNLGLMNSLKKNIYSHVMVKLNGVTQAQVKEFPRQPIYTSAFDYS